MNILWLQTYIHSSVCKCMYVCMYVSIFPKHWRKNIRPKEVLGHLWPSISTSSNSRLYTAIVCLGLSCALFSIRMWQQQHAFLMLMTAIILFKWYVPPTSNFYLSNVFVATNLCKKSEQTNEQTNICYHETRNFKPHMCHCYFFYYFILACLGGCLP